MRNENSTTKNPLTENKTESLMVRPLPGTGNTDLAQALLALEKEGCTKEALAKELVCMEKEGFITKDEAEAVATMLNLDYDPCQDTEDYDPKLICFEYGSCTWTLNTDYFPIKTDGNIKLFED